VRPGDGHRRGDPAGAAGAGRRVPPGRAGGGARGPAHGNGRARGPAHGNGRARGQRTATAGHEGQRTATAGHEGQRTATAVREGMLRATDHLLNMDPDAAVVECRALLALPDGEVAGAFCLSLATLARAEDRDDPGPELDRFLAQVTEVIAAAEAASAAGRRRGAEAPPGPGPRRQGARRRGAEELRGELPGRAGGPAALHRGAGAGSGAGGCALRIGLYHYAMARLPALVSRWSASSCPRPVRRRACRSSSAWRRRART